MTIRTLKELPLNNDRSNWTLRWNRTMGDAGIPSAPLERPAPRVNWERIIAAVAIVGLTVMVAKDVTTLVTKANANPALDCPRGSFDADRHFAIYRYIRQQAQTKEPTL